MSQSKMADLLDISQSQYSKIEKGISGLSVFTLYKICKELDVRPEDIWRDVEKMIVEENIKNLNKNNIIRKLDIDFEQEN